MNELIAVALITVLATVSPGPDFAMVTRNSFLYGRHSGLLAALGIALGVQIHVFYTMFGVGLLIAHSPALFTVIKVLGALYLIVIGWRSFTDDATAMPASAAAHTTPPRSALSMLGNGLLTNALNPKTTLFVVSTYTQVLQPDTGLATQFAYGLFMSATHLLWFAAVALFFSRQALRLRMLRYRGAVDKGIGAILMLLGTALALSHAAS